MPALCFALAISPPLTHAQDTVAPTGDSGLSPDNLDILESREADLGDHKVIFHRVAPPVLSQHRREQAGAPEASAPLPAELVDSLKRRAQKNRHFLSVTAGIRENGTTELQWTQSGSKFQALSSLNVDLLPVMLEFETDNDVFSYFFTRNTGVAPPDPSSAAPATFRLLTEGLEADPSVAAVAALHDYYNTHLARLQRERVAQLAAFAEHERRKATEPAAPVEDTVIYYWPLENASRPKGESK